MSKPYDPEKFLIGQRDVDGDDDDGDLMMRGGYSAYELIDEKYIKDIGIQGGGSAAIVFPDSLKEKLKELQVPLGLVTRFTPNRINLVKQSGGDIIDADLYNKLETAVIIERSDRGTRKTSGIDAKRVVTRKQRQ